MVRPRAYLLAITGIIVLSTSPAVGDEPGALASFRLPDRWQERFWADPAAVKLLDLDAKSIAALVPEQAGLKHCRCPKCGAAETDDPLGWSIAEPKTLKCRKCATVLPDEQFPAKVMGKVPEEVVEVLPRRYHRYPYHVVEAEKSFYADERVYLSAKRDYEAREFLAKAAMYAAVKFRDASDGANDPRYARLASALILRFAQVYPAYATHLDRPGLPKFLDRADLPPPYRRGYGTAKWDWSGSLDVPLNLAVAYAIVRDDPAMALAGTALGDARPNRTIERDLFRASAEFVKAQPDDPGEMSFLACRGILAAGRILRDDAMVLAATDRLDGVLARGFYHDGTWRSGDGEAQRRVVGQLDGWIGRLLAEGQPAKASPNHSIVGLARAAAGSAWVDPRAETPEVLLASWPSPIAKSEPRRPALLGGAGIARLGIGGGKDALDLELRGLGDFGGIPSGRLALRVAVGGTPVLGDLGGDGPIGWGFAYASASKTGLVVVDGLNQRESIDGLREPAPGSDILFHAADPDFQIVRFADRYAYPTSSRLYRHTVIASAIGESRYAVSIVEVDGGLQHDQVFHGAIVEADWKPSVAVEPGPLSLLPPGMPFLPTARPEDGRWFVQAMGGFRDLSRATIDHPAQVTLLAKDRPGVRLHILGDGPYTAYLGRSTSGSAEGNASLVLRRRSADGSALSTAFVTVIEPLGRMPGLRRVGQLAGPPGVITIAVETAGGTEYLIVNTEPGDAKNVPLPDGRVVRSDGLVARVAPSGLILAGGTFAEVGEMRATLSKITGTVVAAGRSDRPDALGVFRLAEPLPELESLAGRTLLIRHGDGSSRGWTIVAAENLDEGGSRIHVREEAGLRIDPVSTAAKYERFPGTMVPGPHQFGISRIAR